MKRKDVEIGKVYEARISRNLVPVKILAESHYGGWNAKNLKTKRIVRIKTAGKLRGPYQRSVPKKIRMIEEQGPQTVLEVPKKISKMLTREQIEEGLRNGTITKMHLYSHENILRPRGGVMEKESLSLHVFERLQSAFEEWTDEKYGDNPTRKELIDTLQKNLKEEMRIAWQRFRTWENKQ